MHNKKIIPLTIVTILIISIFTPTISSEEQTKNTENLYCEQIEIIYNILANIAEKFPIITSFRIVQSIFDAHDKCCCTPDIEIIKEADINEAYVGDTITYTYTVTNTGGQELTDIYAVDDLLGLVTLGTTTLQPDGQTTGALTYTVQESDLPGPIFNMVLVNGSYCCGYVEDTDCESVDIIEEEPPVNDIQLDKEADKQIVQVGETITYTYVVTNTGDETLTDVCVIDDLLGPVTLNETILAPGEWANGTLTYVVQESDLPGPIINTAVANGSYCGGYVEDTDCESVDIIVEEPPENAIKLEKNADKEIAEIGETITYTYIVTNIGEDWLFGVTVTDDLLGPVTLNETTLAPNEWANGTLTCVVQESDLPGPIINTAIAEGHPCTGEPVTDEDNETVNIFSCKPAMLFKKSPDKQLVDIGEKITYTYIIKNTGNVELLDLNVIDEPLGLVELNTTTLLPGEWAKGNLTYTVTENDFPGPIVNIAIATANTCGCGSLEEHAEALVNINIPCQDPVWVDDSWFSQNDVNQYNPDLIWQINAFNKIQDAVDIACECGTIYVRPGLYHEQILIDKSLELLAEPGTKLYPQILRNFTIDGSTETYKPMIFAFGGKLSGRNIVTTDKISVKIDGFEICGYGQTAIHYHNVGLGCIDPIISNNKIKADIGVFLSGEVGGTSEAEIDESTGIKIHYNYFGYDECAMYIGVWNTINAKVDARYNWWDEDAGPSSPEGETTYDAETDRPANSYLGDRVIGILQFDPWWGIDANPEVKEAGFGSQYFQFKANAFAYDTTGYISDRIEYLWKFDDGFYSTSLNPVHHYDEKGIYYVTLMVTVYSYDIPGVTGYLRDITGLTVEVT